MPKLHRRLSQLEAQHQARLAGQFPPFLVVYPDAWTPADRAALDGTDVEACRAAIARHTGQVPGPATTVVVIAEGRNEPT